MPLYQNAFDIRRELFGEKHPDTALSYNNVAANLAAQGKHAEAVPLLRQESTRHLPGGVQQASPHGQLLQHVAMNLNDQGKYEAAQPHLQKALDIHREVFGEKHPASATGYSNVAVW